MRSNIRRCTKCSRYTLKGKCPECGAETKVPIPARFSPEDHYGEYRRRMRRIAEEE